jgi:hypothetical protein
VGSATAWHLRDALNAHFIQRVLRADTLTMKQGLSKNGMGDDWAATQSYIYDMFK